MDLFNGFELDGIHLVAHGAGDGVGHALEHDETIGIFIHDLVVGVDIFHTVTAGGIGTEVFLFRLREEALAEAGHVGPDLIDIDAVGEVDHVRGVTAGGAHVDLQSGEVTNLPQTLVGPSKAEELHVDKAVGGVEGLGGAAAIVTQLWGNLFGDIVGQLQALVDDVGN